jgi:glycosyltransferase involved in cell wall biosynthesis
MTTARPRLPVAFTFLNDGKEWQGGLNYFRSLFLSLEAAPACALSPVAFVGERADVARMRLPGNVKVVRDSVLDRKSPKWFVDKLLAKAFGAGWLTNALICGQGIDVLSHAGPTGQSSLRNIVWIPDFQHMHLPQFFPEQELRTREALYRDMIARSDRVVLSSEAARRDLAAFSPAHADKARVLRFCAVRPDVDWRQPLDLRAAHGVEGPYFYIPNQLWAHKNHLTAVRALARIAEERPDVSIVCSGSLDDYRNPEHLDLLRAEIARHGLDQRFRLLGLIPYEHIAQLMLQSEAVVNPSQFEGWSTTVEEGKALGLPLILSGIDVHREQCQQGEASFFDTLDDASLAERMRERLAAPARPLTAADHDAAAARHRRRSETFASDFEAIVRELHDAHAH